MVWEVEHGWLTYLRVAELAVRTLETPLTEESLILALRPTLASKQYGSEDLLAKLVAEAVLAVMPKNPAAVSPRLRHCMRWPLPLVVSPMLTLRYVVAVQR